MTTKIYQSPSMEIVKCEASHTLMVSDPTPATSGGPGLNSAPSKVF